MALPYWINSANNKYYLHFKINQPAGTAVSYTILKQDGLSPELPTDFWQFFEDFNGDSLDSSVWDTSSANGSYSVSDSAVNMWNDWGGCCNASCYYSLIKSTATYNLPLRVLLVGNQDPYQSTSGCGRTGPTFHYGEDSVEIITTTDSKNKQGINVRIGDTKFQSSDINAIPDIAPNNFQFMANIGTSKTIVDNYWEEGRILEFNAAPPYTSGQPIGFSGDTDSSSVVDHIACLAVHPSLDTLPEVTIISQDETTMVVQVDDSNTGNTIDLNDFIVTVDVTNFVGGVDEGLNIYGAAIYMLVENPDDGQVYTYDADNDAWVSLNKTKDELTDTDFTNNGILAPLAVNKDKYSELTENPNFLIYTDMDYSTAKLGVRFQPFNRLFVRKVPYNLQDYLSFKQFKHYNEPGYTWSNGGAAYHTLISRDGENWYKYDPNAEHKLTFVATRILNAANQDDINFVYNNGLGLGYYSNLEQEDWYAFFENNYPDYLYLAIVCATYDPEDEIYIDTIQFIVDTRPYWIDVTKDVTIKFTENNIIVTVQFAGTYKIIYLD